MPIIYRSVKGSELTSDEVDGNFQFLDEEKQDTLTFDSTPTDGSSNPVTSDGIYDAIQSKAETSTTLNINGNSYDLSTNREWRVAQGDTGVLEFGGLSANSATTIDIGIVKGYVVDNETDPLNPTYTYIDYVGETNKTVTTVGGGLASYVLIEPDGGGGGTISFQNTFPTSDERKAKIWLGKLGHPSGSITAIGNEPDFITSPQAFARDLFQVMGPYINDGVLAYANGANLQINITSGNIHGNGINFVADNTKPNEVAVGPYTPLDFLPRTQTGAGGGLINIVDVGNYDVAGTVTAIPGPGATSTIRYIYAVPSSVSSLFLIQYGQTTYSNLANAIEAVGRESQVIYNNLPGNSILIGVLVARKDATTLNNTSQAQFFPADRLGQIIGATAGISTGTLQTAYNNSLVPQISPTDALGAVTLRNARALDTSNVLVIQNIAGTDTFSINGNGGVTASEANIGSNFYTTGTFALRVGNGSMVFGNDSTMLGEKHNRTSTGNNIDEYWYVNNVQQGRIRVTNGGRYELDMVGGYLFKENGTEIWRCISNSFEVTPALKLNTSLQFLDTTYKTALDVSAANTLRLGNGFTQTNIIGIAGAGTLQILDTTYKTAFDVSSSGVLRLANGFTNLLITKGTTITTSGITPLTVNGAQASGTVRLTLTNTAASNTSNQHSIIQQVNNASGTLVNSALYSSNLVTTTAGAEDSRIDFTGLSSGAASTFLRIEKATATFLDGINLVLGTTTGMKIGTATSQKLGFWNATPVVQPSGWGTPTGTLTRTTFDTATVTLQQLAERVAAIITDDKTIGIKGA